MSELKSFIVLYDGKFIRAYEESEADKVIAEKDKEIARLDDLAHAHNLELLQKENCIAELKDKLRHYPMMVALASQSKAHIAEAVKLDNQLKELINDGTGEGKDCGGDGEA